MPKLPFDYSRTCIYKLVHNDDINDENIYIGHTTDIVKRRNGHKRRCNNPNNKKHKFKVYQFIRENGDWDNWKMILIEKYPCNDIDEAKARERYWIKELKATLNVTQPNRTKKEWTEDNIEKVKDYKKEYQQNNKDRLTQKNKNYYLDNKEQIIERVRLYSKNNKEKINENKKSYYNNNKEKILEKSKEKMTCECGCILRKDNLKRHIKSQQHQEYLKKNLPII